MIPDTARIRICATINFLGYFAAEVEGFAYALEDRPDVDVVTFDAGDGLEFELFDPTRPSCGRYGTAPEDAIAGALWEEARSTLNKSKMHEAFILWVADRKSYAREHAGELRLVG